MKLKIVLFWVLAVVISLAAMFYQRMTGPTYPKKYEITYQSQEYGFSLPRSNNGRPGAYPVKWQEKETFWFQVSPTNPRQVKLNTTWN